jgi:hypothetical protein
MQRLSPEENSEGGWRVRHFYTSKNYNRDEYKILCEGKFVQITDRTQLPVAVPHNATCPRCLEKLIPKKEAELKKMLETRDRACSSGMQPGPDAYPGGPRLG